MKLFEIDGPVYHGYHGSPNEIIGDFKTSDTGIFFSEDKEYARGYGEHVYFCQITINNPLVYSEDDTWGNIEIYVADIEKMGHDGRIIQYDNGERDIIAFYPHQIQIIRKE